jgi:predicted nuclease of restriction endonuclease-like (RecB) superfamily
MKEHIQKSLVFDQIAYTDKLIEEALDGEARDNPRNFMAEVTI